MLLLEFLNKLLYFATVDSQIKNWHLKEKKEKIITQLFTPFLSQVMEIIASGVPISNVLIHSATFYFIYKLYKFFYIGMSLELQTLISSYRL